MAEQFIGYIETETPRAFLFQDHYWHAPEWMPKSQVTVERDDDTHEVVMSATPWICGQKNIREFKELRNGEGS